MKYVAVHNLTCAKTAPISAEYCASFLTQLRGLMFRSSLAADRGLLLVQGSDSRINSSIHMLFMRFDITAVWINAKKEVVDVKLARRWRPAYFSRGPASYVLEAPASRLDDFHIGDQVRFEEIWLD